MLLFKPMNIYNAEGEDNIISQTIDDFLKLTFQEEESDEDGYFENWICPLLT